MGGSRLRFSPCLVVPLLGMPVLAVVLPAALFSGGCASETKVFTATDAAGEMPVGIPREAKLLWGGKNDKLKWKFGSAGHYWIVEDSNGITLVQGNLKSGDELEVDPKAHLVMLNHAFLRSRELDETSDLRLYFAEK